MNTTRATFGLTPNRLASPTSTPARTRPCRGRTSPRCAIPMPIIMTARRGAGAVERGGLENRCGPFGPPRVRIPPPPLLRPRNPPICRGFAGQPEHRPSTPVGPWWTRSAPYSCGAVQQLCSKSSSDPLGRALQVRVEEARSLVFRTREQVPVAVERHRDRRVAHEGRERLGVHSRGDHQRGERVPAVVQTDRLEPGCLPGPPGALTDRLVGERLAVLTGEEKTG